MVISMSMDTTARPAIRDRRCKQTTTTGKACRNRPSFAASRPGTDEAKEVCGTHANSLFMQGWDLLELDE